MNIYSFKKDYEPDKYSLTLEEMREIHEEMLSEIGNDEDALEIYEELVEKARDYTVFRQNWAFYSREEKMDKDQSRTLCHNSLITKFDMMERMLKRLGKEASWRDKLGRIEDDPDYRKRIGDMACYIMFVNAVCSR